MDPFAIVPFPTLGQAPLTNHSFMVGDTSTIGLEPSSQRTPAVEMREAAPELKMNLLEQVATQLGIKLISSRQPVE